MRGPGTISGGVGCGAASPSGVNNHDGLPWLTCSGIAHTKTWATREFYEAGNAGPERPWAFKSRVRCGVSWMRSSYHAGEN